MQQEIFLGAVDAHYDELTERFTVVNLFGGEIMELFHQHGNVLPNQVEPFGFMDLQGHSVSNILIGDEASAFYASSFPPLFSRPLILPGDVIQMSALQITEDLPQVLPVDPIEILQQADLPPVFVEANGLPVIRPTSTISPFTNQLPTQGSSARTGRNRSPLWRTPCVDGMPRVAASRKTSGQTHSSPPLSLAVAPPDSPPLTAAELRTDQQTTQ